MIAVAAGSATLTQDLPGRLLAYRSAQVRARVEGVVEKRLYEEGRDIAAGAPLFRIDPRTYEANLAAADADLAAARANFDRYKPLLDLKAVSQQEYDEAAARIAILLEHLGLSHQPVLVEHNGQAVLRRDFDDTAVADGDVIEIVRMVAGG